MQRQGFHDAAADRRRDHLARAHRAEDRPALQVADGLGEGCLARGRRGAVADLEGPRRRQFVAPTTRRLRRDPRAPQAIAATPSGWSRWKRRARRRSTATGPTTRRRRRTSPGITVFDDYPLAGADRDHRLDAVLQRLGTGGTLSRRSSTTTSSASRRSELYRDARAMLEKIVAEKWLTAQGVFGLWPANSRRRRRRGRRIRPMRDGRSHDHAAFPAPAGRQAGRTPRLLPRRFHRAEGIRQARTGSARSRSPPASASSRISRASSADHDDYNVDPAQGARRSPRRSVRRTPAPARAQGILGLRSPTKRSTTKR